jgi:hypothetical protein
MFHLSRPRGLYFFCLTMPNNNDFHLDLLKAMHTLLKIHVNMTAEELVETFTTEVNAFVGTFDQEALLPKLQAVRFQKEKIKRILVGDVVEEEHAAPNSVPILECTKLGGTCVPQRSLVYSIA